MFCLGWEFEVENYGIRWLNWGLVIFHRLIRRLGHHQHWCSQLKPKSAQIWNPVSTQGPTVAEEEGRRLIYYDREKDFWWINLGGWRDIGVRIVVLRFSVTQCICQQRRRIRSFQTWFPPSRPSTVLVLWIRAHSKTKQKSLKGPF